MLIQNKIFRAVSVTVFIIHVILFLFIIVASFFPFMNGENYYTVFKGFLFEYLPAVQPFLILLIALFFTACAFFSIKHPFFGIGTLIGSFSFFFLIMLKPITVLALAIPFDISPLKYSRIGDYVFESGFYMFSYASDVIFIDLAFCVFCVIMHFIIKKKTHE